MNRTQSISDDSAAATYLVAAFAVGQALQINDGNLHPIGLLWIAVAIGALFMAVTGRIGWLTRISVTKIAAICLVIQWADLLAWGIGFKRAPGSSIGMFVIAMMIAAIGVAMLFGRSRLRTFGMIVLLLGHALAGAHIIRNTTAPVIDVWYFQQESTAALLRGQNPYGVRYRNVYAPKTDYYSADIRDGDYLKVSHPYPPLTLLMALPARMLGDVRWSHLIALELAAVLITLSGATPRLVAAASRRDGAARPRRVNGIGARDLDSLASFAAAMLLLCPRGLLVVHAAWTEAMVVLCIAFVIFCAMRSPKHLWLALGLALASKQYMVLLAPLMLRLTYRKQIGEAVLLAAIVTLPFVLWNPASFIDSVVLMQVRQPFRLDSLSFPAMLARCTGWQMPSIVGFAVAGAVLFWASRRAPKNVVGFTAASALVLIVFFAFNKQAFCNYYFLVAGMCCCGASVAVTNAPSVVAELDREELKLAA